WGPGGRRLPQRVQAVDRINTKTVAGSTTASKSQKAVAAPRTSRGQRSTPVTDDSPPPINPITPPELGTPPGYSQIVEVCVGRMIFIAGQTAVDADGHVVGKYDFAAQAEQVFHNLS